MRVLGVSAVVREPSRAAFGDWRGKGAPGQSTALHLRGRRVAPTALRCSVSRPRRSTHCAHCVRSVQTIATGQITKRAARAATSPGLAGRAGRGRPAVRKAQAVPRTACVPAHLLGAAQARRGPPGHAFAGAFVLLHTREEPSRQAVPAGGDLWSDEDRRTGVGARSALRELTRRNCLSATNAVSAASSATRPLAENRSAVGAVRRPRNHEPLAGTAWRDAQALNLLAGTASRDTKALNFQAEIAWRDAEALKFTAGTAWRIAQALRRCGHPPKATPTREQTSIASAALHTSNAKPTAVRELT